MTASDPTPLSRLKADLRARALARRAAMPSLDRSDASRRITERVLSHSDYQSASTILVYATMRGEVDTAAICGQALADGKVVAYPLVDWTDETLHAVRMVDPARLAPGRWGLPEPPPDQREPVDHATLELVLVPGVAFDRAGRRMGYGRGMFDRLLKTLPSQARRWGLAFDVQVFDELPTGSHDQPVDVVVTQTRWIEAGESRG